MKKTIIFLLLFFLFPSSALASTTVYSQSTGSNNDYFGHSSSIWSAQEFTPSASGTIDSLKIYVKNGAGSPTGLDAYLYTKSDGSPYQDQGKIGSYSSTVGSSYAEISLSITGSISVTADTNYYIVMKCSSGACSDSNYYHWASDQSVGNPSKYSNNSGSSWSQRSATSKFRGSITVADAPTPTPTITPTPTSTPSPTPTPSSFNIGNWPTPIAGALPTTVPSGQYLHQECSTMELFESTGLQGSPMTIASVGTSAWTSTYVGLVGDFSQEMSIGNSSSLYIVTSVMSDSDSQNKTAFGIHFDTNVGLAKTFENLVSPNDTSFQQFTIPIFTSSYITQYFTNNDKTTLEHALKSGEFTMDFNGTYRKNYGYEWKVGSKIAQTVLCVDYYDTNSEFSTPQPLTNLEETTCSGLNIVQTIFCQFKNWFVAVMKWLFIPTFFNQELSQVMLTKTQEKLTTRAPFAYIFYPLNELPWSDFNSPPDFADTKISIDLPSDFFFSDFEIELKPTTQLQTVINDLYSNYEWILYIPMLLIFYKLTFWFYNIIFGKNPIDIQ